jgi:hypothetical protein
MTLSDTDVLSASQQVAVHFSQSCPPGAHSDDSEFAAAFAQMPSVASVAGVTGDTAATLGNIFAIQTNYYTAVINPVDGIQVGQLRQDCLSALQTLGQSKVIPCSNFTVDIIETGTGGLLSNISQNLTGSGPSLTTTTVIVAIAVIVVVALLFSKEV